MTRKFALYVAGDSLTIEGSVDTTTPVLIYIDVSNSDLAVCVAKEKARTVNDPAHVDVMVEETHFKTLRWPPNSGLSN